jgi:hypothetical protein
MIEVKIDSIRVSLMTQHRIVMLKALEGEHYLPIWIGPCEADAITQELQGTPLPRPMTHDLLKNVIEELGARVLFIEVSALRDEVFYARIVLEVAGQQHEIDARPSDSIALAVRVNVPIYVDEHVMQQAAIVPEEEITSESSEIEADENISETEVLPPDDNRLDPFRDFVNSLDLDDLDDEEDAD